MSRPQTSVSAAQVGDAAAAPPEPSFVPRKEGVTDGAWDKHDRLAVLEALQDAEAAAQHREPSAAPAPSDATPPSSFREYMRLPPLERKILLGLSDAEYAELAKSLGEKAFRGKQMRTAVVGGARSIGDITTLSKALRQRLEEEGWRTGRSAVHHRVESHDGVHKFLLRLADGRVVETVGIPSLDNDGKRLTACVSSQVGCPMRCTFCATGKGGYARNLLVHEIVDQVLTIQEELGRRVSNVVFMGMGEPLLNLPSVLEAVTFLNEDLGISMRKITISTVGVPNAIPRLAAAHLQATLAVSIHAPTQQLREQIVPSAKAYPIEALMKDCAEYFKATGRRVSFEYTLLSGVNDGPEHAAELARLLRRHGLGGPSNPALMGSSRRGNRGGAQEDNSAPPSSSWHVNLIPWNPVDESEFKRPSRDTVRRFKEALESKGIPCSVRQTRGLEAAAACGQLRNRYQKEPVEGFAGIEAQV
ncbi:unnamed protein product [Pedinophyceae sp. YPF-701]|nr:unnamed protein product [Pedinophyceae sp. YPF-701]